MKLCDYLVDFIAKKNIDIIFGYQGGSVTHLIDAVYRNEHVQYVQTYHEQGAAFAADAYARAFQDRPGVVIASNGPGATNLITGIANAYCDSVPMLCITGQVHTYAMKRNDCIRQENFQEIDIKSMVRPVTKYCVTIMNEEDIIPELEKAYYMAMEGRKGPVLIDIPVDIQANEIHVGERGRYHFSNLTEIQPEVLDEVYDLLKQSRKPLLLAGGGISMANAKEELRKLIAQSGIPVVTSMQGIDCVRHEYPGFLGFIGTHGNEAANMALAHADLLIVLGSRLDIRQTGKDRKNFAPNAKIIHIDIDCNELKHTVHEEFSLHMDLKQFLIRLNAYPLEKCSDAWLKECQAWKEQEQKEAVAELFEVMGKSISGHAAVCFDVGQNQVWAAKYLRIYHQDFKLFNSGGLGSMGYALPAAIGAFYSRKYDCFIAVVGDGGLQMNVQELCLIGSEQLPVNIVVINNHALGLIREMHEKYYGNRCVGSVEGFSQPDLSYLAKSYHIGYKKIENIQQMQDIGSNKQGPVLYDVDFSILNL